MAPQRPNSAFSLLELMIVIVITAVVVALAYTSIAQTKSRQLAVKCVASQRQVGRALLEYANDHLLKIPPRMEPDPEKPGSYLGGNTAWFVVLRAKGYFPAAPFNERSFHFCPEFQTSPTPSGFETYGLRRWHSPGGADDTTQSLLSIPVRSDFFLLACSHNTATGRQGYCIDGHGQWLIRSDTRGFVKALYADGHVAMTEAEYFSDLHQRQSEFHVGSGPYKVHKGE